jgi:hypothetical protein
MRGKDTAGRSNGAARKRQKKSRKETKQPEIKKKIKYRIFTFCLLPSAFCLLASTFNCNQHCTLRCYWCFMGLEGSRQAGFLASAVVTVQYTLLDSFVDFAVSLRHTLLDFLHQLRTRSCCVLVNGCKILLHQSFDC